MFGKVISYEEDSNKGIIQDSKGDVYLFDAWDLREGTVPYVGMSVYFELTKESRMAGRVHMLRVVLPLFDWSAIASIILVVALTACAGQKGETGAEGVQGKQGNEGQEGPAGQNGSDGATGAQGPQGNPGQDLANVHVVQFCPSQGATVHTPSHFPEYGICISNKLYAVLDDSFRTWLAELVPGTYQTTSTGLICTFTVTANCGVQ